MDHDLNVAGALIVAVGDRMRDAVEDAAGMTGAGPAALAALHEWAGGRSIDTLAGGLRLSHSRTVRVIDRLAADGLARRARDPSDARSVLVELTPAGERAGAQVLAARAAALEACFSVLGADERAAFAALAEALLGGATTGRRAAGAICRLCDAHACGHRRGPLPGHARRGCSGARRLVRRRDGRFPVVVPHQVLQIMSEEARRGDVVLVERGFGLVVLGPLYAVVEMAHGPTLTGPAAWSAPVWTEFGRCGQSDSASRNAPSRSEWRNAYPSARARSGTRALPVDHDGGHLAVEDADREATARGRTPGGAGRGRARARSPGWSPAPARWR